VTFSKSSLTLKRLLLPGISCNWLEAIVLLG